MNAIRNDSFIKTLRQHPLIDQRQLEALLKSTSDHYQILLRVVHHGWLPRAEAATAWADGLGVAWINLREAIFHPEIVAKIPRQFALDNLIIPIYMLGDRLSVAMADPKNEDLLKEATKVAGVAISPIFALDDAIRDAIEIQYLSTELVENISEKLQAAVLPLQHEVGRKELEAIAGDQSIVELVRSLMLLAVKEDASDIHVEPAREYLLVRFRIDGVLQEKLRFSREVLPPLVSRIKILAGMDITERRRPQDGRAVLELANQKLVFRVSTVPLIEGEKIVLRRLGQVQRRNVPQLEELYLSSRIYQQVRQLIHTPSGAFFITGPTGSGKTTTLFSALQRINTPEVNIMTIEDPVEYRLAGINQLQVNPEIGVTFAAALRAILRQDPDVLLIGEIRDLETARISTEAALTGHLVFATLHTNDALQAVTRLVEIGVEPFLVGPSLIGVMSQRLLRRVCDKCKEEYLLTPGQMDELFEWDGMEPVTFYRGKGCPACKFTGYRGRLAIFEMIILNDRLRKLVMTNAPLPELREAAVETGYQPMRYDGIKKVLRGLTTIEEVDRVAHPDLY
ncbi:MAG: ATPase, T2SS/T4P/T4SS family [Thermodesulfobacteriota bacterium]